MSFFFFNDTATTEIYTLSLHDALPILALWADAQLNRRKKSLANNHYQEQDHRRYPCSVNPHTESALRSEEHTSELQSRQYLVCRLLLEKKKIHAHVIHT